VKSVVGIWLTRDVDGSAGLEALYSLRLVSN
jgi:hypothetical protein